MYLNNHKQPYVKIPFLVACSFSDEFGLSDPGGMYTANYQLVPRQYAVVNQGLQGTSLAVQMSPQGGASLSPGDQFSQPAGFDQQMANFPNQNNQFTFPNQNPQMLPSTGHQFGLPAQNLGQINAGILTGGQGQNILIPGQGQSMIVHGQTILPQNPAIFQHNPALNSPQEVTASHHANLANIQSLGNNSSVVGQLTGFGSQLVPGPLPMNNSQVSPMGSPNSTSGLLSPNSSRALEISPTTGRKRKSSGQKSKLKQQQETVIQLNNQLQFLQQMQQSMLSQSANTVNYGNVGTNPVIQNLATQNQTLPSFGHFLLHHQQQQQQQVLPNQNTVDVQQVDGNMMGSLQMVGAGGSLSQNPATHLIGGQNITNIFPGQNLPYNISGASNLANNNIMQLQSGRVNIDLHGQVHGANLNIGLNNLNSQQFTNYNANLLQGQGQSGTGSLIAGGLPRTQQLVRPTIPLTKAVHPVCVSCVSKTTDTISVSNVVKTRLTQDPKTTAVTSVTFGVSTIPTSKILSPKSKSKSENVSKTNVDCKSKPQVSEVKVDIPISKNVTGPNSVVVPFGWVRQLEEQSIVYYR